MSTEDEKETGELPIPPPCQGDDDATEVLRLWKGCGDGRLYMIRAAAWKDPYDWGTAFADVIRYYAKCAHENGLTRETEDGKTVRPSVDDILARAVEGLECELEKPTDTPRHWEHGA